MNGIETLTVKQLLEVAKDAGIIGRHAMKKDQLIEAILKVTPKEEEPVVEKAPEKESYIDNARIGVLIAFKVSGTKALSGMVEEIHQQGFVVKTKNGVRFTVKRKDVMWVKTGNRWPRGVYLALKGESASEGYKAVN